MSSLALPYFQVTKLGPLQSFGVIALVAVALGVLVVVLLGRNRGIPGAQLGLIVPLATIGVIFGSHFFDVAWYRWDQASAEPMLWLRVFDGVSVFGGVLGAALVVWPLSRGHQTPVWADLVALGLLVGLTIGRIGCMLVHDHPGLPTDLPIGIDFPVDRLYFNGARELAQGATTVRLHDLGMLEFMLLLPLAIGTFAMRNRFARPGTLAMIIAVGAAVIRFPLDFLRLPDHEPTRLGLTGGQWGCIVLVIAVVAFALLRRPADAR